ncbi:TetR family transcriptional regulator C-terminal domain-containing protein [Leucobacter soli]|uniref:TetR family transcriptional regulator C-terminal domain-containing protein n=1 Tax=Leucobacter soli TaxID=2812850 RepID=UPI003616C27D
MAATIQDWQQHVFGAIRQGQGDGSVRADADAVVTAQILTALVDGLLSRLAIDSLTWDAARASSESPWSACCSRSDRGRRSPCSVHGRVSTGVEGYGPLRLVHAHN